jgi:1-acyl-sn-glycerol-3-phosphate acyltransferase
MSLFVDDDVHARVRRLEVPFNAAGYDRYGTSRKHLEVFFSFVAPLYRRYFRVEATGLEHIPARGRAMIIGNHSGGYAIDGLLTVASCFFELEPPRLAQGMAEKFLSAMPVSSTLTARLGHLTGLPEHAERLLNDDRLLMVFPEGARGTAKLYKERWSLVRFGSGFIRLALATKTPIVPMAFVGGGDVMPTVANLYKLGRLMGVPYIPVSAYGLPLPLPRPCAVHYGAPMTFHGTGREDDDTVEKMVVEVRDRVAALLADGRRRHEQRVRPLFFLGGGG